MNNSFYLDGSQAADTYVLFRGLFELKKESRVRLNHVGASWYRMSLDGDSFAEEPARFSPVRPEFLSESTTLPTSKYVLKLASPARLPIEPGLLEEGPLATSFGYADDGWIEASWERNRSRVRYTLTASHPIEIALPGGEFVKVEQESERVLDLEEFG